MHGSFRIGEWLVEPQINTLTNADKPTRVEPKIMQVLVCLAERPLEVVSKEKLIREVWGDTFVTDDVLTHSISELRKVFADDAKEPRYIQTIPRSGYRLIVPVSDNERKQNSELKLKTFSEHLIKRINFYKLSVVLVALIVAIAGIVYVGVWDHQSSLTNLPPQRALSRLTFDPGLQSEPTWSPDGRFIAYSSDRSGNFDIWVKPVGGGDPVQVTHSPAHDYQPDWSPNGSNIVFRSEREGGGREGL